MDKREQLIRAVADAWNNPGPWPRYHEKIQRQFKTLWPTLARAVEMLANHERTVTQPTRNKEN